MDAIICAHAHMEPRSQGAEDDRPQSGARYKNANTWAPNSSFHDTQDSLTHNGSQIISNLIVEPIIACRLDCLGPTTSDAVVGLKGGSAANTTSSRGPQTEILFSQPRSACHSLVSASIACSRPDNHRKTETRQIMRAILFFDGQEYLLIAIFFRDTSFGYLVSFARCYLFARCYCLLGAHLASFRKEGYTARKISRVETIWQPFGPGKK